MHYRKLRFKRQNNFVNCDQVRTSEFSKNGQKNGISLHY